jgi:GNAT superfamily N-acetyltransferase
MRRTVKVANADYLITTDKDEIDVVAVYDFLSKKSSWSKNIPLETVKTSIENSLNFGLFHNNKQIGYARVISDYATIAYLGDVYILEEYRGKGLSKKLMDVIIQYPSLQNLRRWILLTTSAKWLYQKYNFTALTNSDWYMELYNPVVYQK